MSDIRLYELVKRLKDQTVKGAVSWERTTDDDVFQATFRGYLVRIKIRPAIEPIIEDPAIDVGIEVLNVSRQVIEEFWDTDVQAPPGAVERPFAIMLQTHRLAKRSALGVDKAIDSLLSQLEDPPF
jgi:hypothetical protein